MFDWITALVSQTGYAGITLLMLAENVFPPIPSELIMPLAGFTAARGELSLVGVIISGMLGSVAGALVWYETGRRVGVEGLRRLAARHGRWLTMAPEDLGRAVAWFRRHAGLAVLVGRLIPAVRTLISVPAGVAAMRLPVFVAWAALGTATWTALLAVTGYLLEAGYAQVAEWLNPVTSVIAAAIVLAYAYRVATFRPAASGGG